jgi:hypothetical protein
VNDEAENLALLHVIETHDPDVGVGILRTASFYFIEYFGRSSSVEQRKLPQSPIVHFWCGAFAEFYSGDVALIQNVLHLLVNLAIAEGWQV